MKHVSPLLFILIFSPTFPNQLPKEREEQVSELQKEGYNLIDAIFMQAKASVEARTELMDNEWWSKQAEVKELRNLLSDAMIIFTFDKNADNPIPQKLAAYVESKIKEDVPHIYAIDGISINCIKDYSQFCHTMCKLSGGHHCGRMMSNVESDHFDKMLKLKLQKMARKQARKEDAERLRDVLLFGGHR
jgi:hypothetical protein